MKKVTIAATTLILTIFGVAIAATVGSLPPLLSLAPDDALLVTHDNAGERETRIVTVSNMLESLKIQPNWVPPSGVANINGQSPTEGRLDLILQHSGGINIVSNGTVKNKVTWTIGANSATVLPGANVTVDEVWNPSGSHYHKVYTINARVGSNAPTLYNARLESPTINNPLVNADGLSITNGKILLAGGVYHPSYGISASNGIRGSTIYGMNSVIGPADKEISHFGRNRWYSRANGIMEWTKSDGTTQLMSTTNGVFHSPGGFTGVPIVAGGKPAAREGYAQFYAATNAGVVEMFVMGSDGTETQISPHADDAPPGLYDAAPGDMKELIYREENAFLPGGMVSFINVRRMARLTELNSRAMLYLAGQQNTSTSNALAKLKAMTPGQRQVIATETFAEYAARTGNNLVPLDWTAVENTRQAAYEAERSALIQRAKTNQEVTIPPQTDVRRPKPAWMR